MKINSSYVGLIIGRNGCRIKEIQQASGARVHFSEFADDQGNKSVEVTGSPSQVVKAKKLIEEAINQAGHSIDDHRHHSGLKNPDRFHERGIKSADPLHKRGINNPSRLHETDINYPDHLHKNRGGNNSDRLHEKAINNTNLQHKKGGNNIRPNNIGVGTMVSVASQESTEQEEDWDRECEEVLQKKNARDHQHMTQNGGIGKEIDRVKGDTHSERFYVNTARVFRMIGPNGSTIKDLESETNTLIQVSKQPDSNRRTSVEVYGRAEENIKEAKQLIKNLGVDIYDSGNEDVVFEDIFVANDDVSRIIGQNGTRVREMEESSGCTILISKQPDSKGYNHIELTGSRRSVDEAINKIERLNIKVHSAEDGQGNARREPMGDYKDNNQTETIYLATPEISRLIGKAGSRIREFEADSGCRIEVYKFHGKDGLTGLDLIGSPGAIVEVKQLLREAGFRIVYKDEVGEDNVEEDRKDGSEEMFETIYVVSSEAENILGPDWSRLRSMEEESGCRLQIFEDSQGYSCIEMSGDRQAIWEARRIIQDSGLTVLTGEEQGDGGEERMVENDLDSSETIFVDSSMVGLIIGREGNKKRELEAQSGCSIQIPREFSTTGHTPVTLSGGQAAITEAKRLIQDFVSAKHNHCEDGGGGEGQQHGSDSEVMTETLFINSSRVGCIIGRGGKTRRQLEADSKCNILISDPDTNGFNSVKLTGSNAAILNAKRLINSIVGQKEEEEDNNANGRTKDNDSSAETIYIEAAKVGRIMGRGGCKKREIEADSGCKIQIPKESNRDGFNPIKLSGSQSQIMEAKRLIHNAAKWVENGDGDGGGREIDTKGEGEESETLYLESWKVGKIIGRGGSRKRELEADSGCKIQVSKGPGPNGLNSVFLCGTPSTILEAKRLIQNIINNELNEDEREIEKKEEPRKGNGQETIYLDGAEVGRVIGRGGSRIREIETESGCKIQVVPGGSQGHTPLQLSGSDTAMSEAQRLIKDTGVRIFNKFGECEDKDEETEEKQHISETQKRPLIDWSSLREKQKEYDQQKFSDLPPIIKDFYQEEPHIAKMTYEEVRSFRKENNNIMVEGPEGGSESVPHPVKTFQDAFRNYPLILEQIKKQNFVKPSPIQSQSWPILMQGKDLIGIAQTGTGKTLAFLLPALIHIDSQLLTPQQREGPSVLILSPTRELAQQIELEVNKINYKGIRSTCVFGGGGNRRDQLQKVKKGVEIVVATPGRLNDFLMNGIISVKNVTYLVMDEADRMLDLGFELEIKKVMLDIRPDRQTVMTSATWPPSVQRLADQYMTNPYRVFVGTLDLAAVHSVKQQIEFVNEEEKKSILLDFISQMTEEDKLIVFVGKKMIADDVSSDLAMNNIMCQCLHGDREQCDREAALEEFRDGTVKILVATDVASRGLDVKDITHVINYDFPRHIEEYVHRIGRTGRAGRTGTSLTFMTRNDWRSAQQLIDIMSEANQEIPDELVAMAERFSARQLRDQQEGSFGFRGGRGGGRGGRGRRNEGAGWS